MNLLAQLYEQAQAETANGSMRYVLVLVGAVLTFFMGLTYRTFSGMRADNRANRILWAEMLAEMRNLVHRQKSLELAFWLQISTQPDCTILIKNAAKKKIAALEEQGADAR